MEEVAQKPERRASLSSFFDLVFMLGDARRSKLYYDHLARNESGQKRFERGLKRLAGVNQDQIDREDDTIGILHEICRMRVKGRDFVEVAIKCQRAGIAQVQTMQRLEPEPGHELKHLLPCHRAAFHVGLRSKNDQITRIVRDALQSDLVAE